MASKKRKLYTQDLFEDDYEATGEAESLFQENHPNGLRCVKEIPKEFRKVFSSTFLYFNEVQSKVFEDVYNSDVSLALTAPTSSGKTVLMELGIIRLLMLAQNFQFPPDFRIVYIAPTKALISEKFQDWTEKFRNLVKVKVVTGDDDLVYLEDLSEYQLILSTPEKWDSLTRRWRDDENFLQSIKLFLIDEVHLLNDERRGSTLEAIVTRMKSASASQYNSADEIQAPHQNIRFICISATIPNIVDVAAWLKTSKTEVKSFEMNADYRPVKLEKIVLGFPFNKQMTSFRFDINLNYKLAGVIRQYSNDKPTMIFCNSRKSIELAANALETALKIEFSNAEFKTLLEIAAQLQDEQLKKLVKKGIAYHHAGLSVADRTLIENSFRSSAFAILLCTTTLSMGVNLPAHLVVIKSTDVYRKGKSEEYDDNTMLQMIGRAGRPQFDNSGTVVIMTQSCNVNKYQNLVAGRLPIESNLHANLTEHLNSEIVLQTITSASVALDWLRSTFLYVRVCKNQEYYGFAKALSREKLDEKLQELCELSIAALEKQRMLTMEVDGSVASTVFGKLMSQFYMTFDTAKMFNQLKGNESQEELLSVLACAPEFKDFTIRNNDRKCLNQINDDNLKPLRYPIRGKIKSVDLKISCILQAVLENVPIRDYSLENEVPKILLAAQRLTKCSIEYMRATQNNTRTGIFRGLLQAVTLTKCLSAQLWENSRFVSRQIDEIGATYCGAMVKAGLISFKGIKNAEQIEKITGKPPPFGVEVVEFVNKLPMYEISLKKSVDEEATMDLVVSQVNPFWDKIKFGAEASLLVGDSQNNLLLYWDDLNYQLANGVERMTASFKYGPDSDIIIANVVHSRLVGIDVMVTFDTKLKRIPEIRPKPVTKPKMHQISDKVSQIENRKQMKKNCLNKSITDYFGAVAERKELVIRKPLPKPEIPDTPGTSFMFKTPNPLPRPEIADSPVIKPLPRPEIPDTPFKKPLPRPEILDTPFDKPLLRAKIPISPSIFERKAKQTVLAQPKVQNSPPIRPQITQMASLSTIKPARPSSSTPSYLKYNPTNGNQGPPMSKLLEDFIDPSLFARFSFPRHSTFEDSDCENGRDESITSYFREEKKVQEPKKSFIEEMLFGQLNQMPCKLVMDNQPKPEISEFTSSVKRKLEALELPDKPKMARSSCISLREATKELYSPSQIREELYHPVPNYGNFLNIPPLPEQIKTPNSPKTFSQMTEIAQQEFRKSLLRTEVYTNLDPVAQVAKWKHLNIIFNLKRLHIPTSQVFEEIPMIFRDYENFPKLAWENAAETIAVDEKVESIIQEVTIIPDDVTKEIKKLDSLEFPTPRTPKNAKNNVMDELYMQHIFNAPILDMGSISNSVVQRKGQGGREFVKKMLQHDMNPDFFDPDEVFKKPVTALDSVLTQTFAPNKSIFEGLMGCGSNHTATQTPLKKNRQKPRIVLETVLDDPDEDIDCSQANGIFCNTPSLGNLSSKFRANKSYQEQNWPMIVNSILGLNPVAFELKPPSLVDSTTSSKRMCIQEIRNPWKKQNIENEFGSFQAKCRPSTSGVISPDSTSNIASKYQLYVSSKAESKGQREQKQRLAGCKAKMNETGDFFSYLKDFVNIKMDNFK